MSKRWKGHSRLARGTDFRSLRCVVNVLQPTIFESLGSSRRHSPSISHLGFLLGPLHTRPYDTVRRRVGNPLPVSVGLSVRGNAPFRHRLLSSSKCFAMPRGEVFIAESSRRSSCFISYPSNLVLLQILEHHRTCNSTR
jgi:hypothetical protein